jgi:uncharacterized membrane protein
MARLSARAEGEGGEFRRAGGDPLLWPGVAIGIGLAGTLDEVILHQILHWHHFYDRSTAAVGLLSDGLFHVFSTGMLVGGLLWLLRLRRRLPASLERLYAGVYLGLGGFNLYDGTIQHKVLKLHQIRPEARDQLPYDVVFVAIALAFVLLGVAMLRLSRSAPRPATPGR